MNKHNDIAKLILGLVPQWIGSIDGRGNESLNIGKRRFPFWALSNLNRNLQKFKDKVEKSSEEWSRWLNIDRPPSAPALLQEAFAMKWLDVIAPEINWHKAISYISGLSSRTYENDAITSNIIFSKGIGTVDITDRSIQKLVDPLAASMQTFFRVDRELRLIDYGVIKWKDIPSTEEYKLYPEFLHPFNAVLGADDTSIHHTSRGDVLVLQKGGLVAARRKGNWRVYQVVQLMQSLQDLIGDYWVAANTFEFILDLSFRRHGALLVFDPDHKVLGHIANSASLIADGTNTSDSIRQAFKNAVKGIQMGKKDSLAAKKRLMIELASIDGALVFDKNEILAIGALINADSGSGNYAGARTTAAWSALSYGAHPIKVSADGDIAIHFKGDERFGDRPSVLSFL